MKDWVEEVMRLIWTDEILEAMARAHDAEDAAQRGEPDPWSLDETDMVEFQEFRCERLTAMRAAVWTLCEPKITELTINGIGWDARRVA